MESIESGRAAREARQQLSRGPGWSPRYADAALRYLTDEAYLQSHHHAGAPETAPDATPGVTAGAASPRTADDVVRALGPTQIDALPWQPLQGTAGVEHKVLWRSGELVVGLLQLAPGATEPGHVHHDAEHHAYVLRGAATVAGRHVPTGGFIVVPAGARHATTADPTEGCTLFYTYLPGHR